jgi:hypothetical protein
MQEFEHAYCVSQLEKYQQKIRIPPIVLHVPISVYNETNVGVFLWD